MRCVVANAPGGKDGILHRLHAGDRAGAQRGAVHAARVQLDVAGGREASPRPGIERGIVLEHHGGRLRRVERAASLQQDPQSGFGGGPRSQKVRLRVVVRPRSGPAVNHHGRPSDTVQHCVEFLLRQVTGIAHWGAHNSADEIQPSGLTARFGL